MSNSFQPKPRAKKLVDITELQEFINNSPKPTICFDVDGVLALTTSALFEELNKQFGKNYTYENMTDFDMGAFLEPEVLTWSRNRFCEPDFYPGVPCGKTAIKSMQKLSELPYNIVIVTDRVPEVAEVTQTWLNKNGANYDYLVVGGWGTKRNLVQGYKGKAPLVVIDDNVNMSAVLKRPNVFLMVPHVPWSVGKITPTENILHFKIWQQVLDRIEALDLFNHPTLYDEKQHVFVEL